MLCLFGTIVNAQQPAVKAIHFAVNSPGSPPFAYLENNTKRYMGLARDFFDVLESTEQIKVRFVDSNRVRSEQYIINGSMDVFLSNPLWLKNPTLFISSEAILLHRIYLYSAQAFRTDFSLTDLRDKKICTRKGFVYSGLQQKFTQHELTRVDASNQLAMASMLINGRCDFALMNEFNAALTFSDPGVCATAIFQSPEPSSTLDLFFVMRADLTSLKEAINRQLLAFKSSGQLQESLEKHSKGLSFPTSGKCIL